MILASKAFPNNVAMADLMAMQPLLKGCKHPNEARMVIRMNRCSLMKRLTRRVVCLTVINFGWQKGWFSCNCFFTMVRSFFEISELWQVFMGHVTFLLPSNLHACYTKSPSSPFKSALSEIMEQCMLMREDFVWFEGKLVNFVEKFTDMADKISVMNNEINEKSCGYGY